MTASVLAVGDSGSIFSKSTTSTMPLSFPTPRDEAPTIGFTAVNSDHHRSGSFRASDSTRPKTSVSSPPAMSGHPDYSHAHVYSNNTLAPMLGWRPDERAATAETNGRAQSDPSQPSKRKRTPSDDGERDVARNGRPVSPSRDPTTTIAPSPPRTHRPPEISTEAQPNPSIPDVQRSSSVRASTETPLISNPSNPNELVYAGPPGPRPDIAAELARSVQRQFPHINNNGDMVSKEGRAQSVAQASSPVINETADSQNNATRKPSATEDRNGPTSVADSGSASPRDGSPDEQDAQPQDNAQPDNAEASAPDKKRKRNFSNRTKTGCHTCRQRKKKCDEGKPECGNCTRGQFPCGGYGPKPPSGAKPQSRSSMVPLQPNHPPMHPGPTGYYDGYHVSPSHHYGSQWSDRRPGSETHVHPPQYPPGPHGPPPPLGPPVQGSSDYRAPSGRETWRPPYGQPELAQPAYPTERLPPTDYSQLTPLDGYQQYRAPNEPWHQPQHNGHPSLPSQAVFPPPNGRIVHPGQAGPPPRTQQGSPSAIVGPHAGTATGSSVVAVRQLPTTNPTSERWNMILGRPFRPFVDDELMQDRKHCAESLFAYNKACQPKSNTLKLEKERFFRQIIQPAQHPFWSGMRESYRGPSGSCGTSTIVEVPFHCEYGFNLHLGDDVVVMRNCQMQDTAEIHIGNRSIIGPNVKFYCMTASVESDVRNGSRGTFIGGAITVEEDCFVGADAIIMPFRTIGRGSIVGAGSVVTKDVKPYTIVAGNPAKFVRTIESGPSVDKHKDPDIQSQNEKMAASMLQRWGLPASHLQPVPPH